MTYHSLAIYYDNQLAENEQKRVSLENRFANLLDSHRSEKMNDGTARASFLEEGCAPTFQFLSQHALSYHAAFGLHRCRLRAHRACSLAPCRMLSRTMRPSGSSSRLSGTSRMISRTMPPGGPHHACSVVTSCTFLCRSASERRQAAPRAVL